MFESLATPDQQRIFQLNNYQQIILGRDMRYLQSQTDYSVSLFSFSGTLTHCMLGNFSCFLSSAGNFSKLIFRKKTFKKTIRISTVWTLIRLVGPYLGPNCLPSLSADDTGRHIELRISDEW